MRVSSSSRTQGKVATAWRNIGAVIRLVQQPPDHHRRVVSIAEYHFLQALIVTLAHLGRVGQAPTPMRFFVNQQSDLVAQVELVAGRPCRR